MTRKHKNKTKYCIHWWNCDRSDFFENNPETYTMPRNIEVDTFEDAMDNIWEGK